MKTNAFRFPPLASVISRILACAFTLAFLSPAYGALMFGTFTNSVGQPDTNVIRFFPISTPIAADGGYFITGLPVRVTPDASGYAVTNLGVGNYLATNAFLGTGILFRAPDDSGQNLYSIWSNRISGASTFVTIVYGTNPAPTFQALTNSLGFTPISATEVTNTIASATPTNFWSANATLWLSNIVANARATWGIQNSNDVFLATNTLGGGLATSIAAKQASLGYTPATNTFAGIRAALTFAPQPTNANLSGFATLQTNQVASTNIASASQSGLLSAANWTTFNAKQAALGFNPQFGSLNGTNWANLQTNQMVSTNQLIVTSNAVVAQIPHINTNQFLPGSNITFTTNTGTVTIASTGGSVGITTSNNIISGTPGLFVTNGTGAAIGTGTVAIAVLSMPKTAITNLTTELANGTNFALTIGLGATNNGTAISNAVIAYSIAGSNAAVAANALRQFGSANLTNYSGRPTNTFAASLNGFTTNETLKDPTMTGTFTINSSDEINADGSASFGTGHATIDQVGNVAAASFSGDGDGITGIDAANITQNTLALARLPVIQGVNLLDASNLLVNGAWLFKSTTNLLVVTNAGVSRALGQYIQTTAGTWTNKITTVSIVVQSTNLTALIIDGTNGYTLASNIPVGRWTGTGPNGVADSKYGAYFNTDAAYSLGQGGHTNVTDEISSATNGLWGGTITLANAQSNTARSFTLTVSANNTNYANGLAVNGTNFSVGISNWAQTQFNSVSAGNGFQTNNGTGTNNIFTTATLRAGLNANSATVSNVATMSFANEVNITASALSSFAGNSVVIGGVGNLLNIQSGEKQRVVIIGGSDNALQTVFPISNAGIFSGAENNVSNSADYSVILGGYRNKMGHQSDFSFIGAGSNNTIIAGHAAIVGGANNSIVAHNDPTFPDNAYNGIFSGRFNAIQTNGQHSVILGGVSNIVAASNSIAMGTRSLAAHDNSFVWNNNPSSQFSTATNQQWVGNSINGFSFNTNDASTNAVLKVAGPGNFKTSIRIDQNDITNLLVRSSGGSATNLSVLGTFSFNGNSGVLSTNWIYASGLGAKLNSNVEAKGNVGSNDYAVLQAALDSVTNRPSLTLVIDGPALIDKALTIHSNTTVIFPNWNCGILLATNSHCPIFKNDWSTNSTWGPNIQIVGGTLNQNGTNQHKRMYSGPDNCSNQAGSTNFYTTAVAFFGVSNLFITGTRIMDASAYAIILGSFAGKTVLSAVDCNFRYPAACGEDFVHVWDEGDTLEVYNCSGNAVGDNLAINVSEVSQWGNSPYWNTNTCRLNRLIVDGFIIRSRSGNLNGNGLLNLQAGDIPWGSIGDVIAANVHADRISAPIRICTGNIGNVTLSGWNLAATEAGFPSDGITNSLVVDNMSYVFTGTPSSSPMFQINDGVTARFTGITSDLRGQSGEGTTFAVFGTTNRVLISGVTQTGGGGLIQNYSDDAQTAVTVDNISLPPGMPIVWDNGSFPVLTNIFGSALGLQSFSTNFVINTVRSNIYATSVTVKVMASAAQAAVAGTVRFDLVVNGVRESGFSFETTTSTVAVTNAWPVWGTVPPFKTYYWTNTSVGSGNATAIISGTGRVIR